MITLNPLHISKPKSQYCLSIKKIFNSRTYTHKTKSGDALEIDISLYLVTNSRYATRPGELYYKSKRFVEAGGTTIQLRFLPNEVREYLDLALLLKRDMTQWGAGNANLVINDDLGVAVLARAGLHVGPTDISPERAKEIMEGRPIGFTAETLEDVLYANESDCVSYVGIQVYPSKYSKEDSKKVWGEEGLKEAVVISKKKIVAIGGITEKNIVEVFKILRPGDGIAIVGDILKHDDTFDVTRRIRRLIDDHFKERRTKE